MYNHTLYSRQWKQERAKQGFCATCGTQPPIINTKTCERCKKRSRDWYKNNRESHIKRGTKYSANRPREALLYAAKSRAKKNDIEFNLTIEDVTIPLRCPLLDVKLTSPIGSGKSWTSASLDRIDPVKGYVKENVWVISKKANLMKNNATFDELEVFAKHILELIVK